MRGSFVGPSEFSVKQRKLKKGSLVRMKIRVVLLVREADHVEIPDQHPGSICGQVE
jgi:hypothetical protein